MLHFMNNFLYSYKLNYLMTVLAEMILIYSLYCYAKTSVILCGMPNN